MTDETTSSERREHEHHRPDPSECDWCLNIGCHEPAIIDDGEGLAVCAGCLDAAHGPDCAELPNCLEMHITRGIASALTDGCAPDWTIGPMRSLTLGACLAHELEVLGDWSDDDARLVLAEVHVSAAVVVPAGSATPMARVRRTAARTREPGDGAG